MKARFPAPHDPGADQRAVVGDVLLMTSELATNACMHSGGPVELTVAAVGPGRLGVEVLDANPEPPVLRSPAAPSRPGGHGLRVWGSEARPGGEAVWFEVESTEAMG
ncbi:ATP-binding protein [Streptacidiphilus neutrinimicus]|uniref:ATP-binding protein n=1 Tax=Streptacidiphilus neutrinimicus TaxID=105420 RepID=UPI0005A622AF|nr:ATP-binding protein [Streptacidiphilus neutrinimicus]